MSEYVIANRHVSVAETAAKATKSSSNVLPMAEGLATPTGDSVPPADGGSMKSAAEGRKEKSSEAVEASARKGDPDVSLRLGEDQESADSTLREGAAPLHADDGLRSSGDNCPGDARTEGQAGEGRHVAKKTKMSVGRTKIRADQEEQPTVPNGSASASLKAAKGQQGIKAFFSKADKGGKG